MLPLVIVVSQEGKKTSTQQTQNALNFFFVPCRNQNQNYLLVMFITQVKSVHNIAHTTTIHTNFVALFRFWIIFFCRRRCCYTNKKNLKFKKFLNKKQIASYIGKCMYNEKFVIYE